MTREEAIHFAECLKNNWTINFADMEAFCDMAIEALYKPTSDDLIIQGRLYGMKKHYIHAGWINCCMLCEYNHQKRYEKPCQGCKRRTNPKVPAKELIIAGTKYLRGGDKE